MNSEITLKQFKLFDVLSTFSVKEYAEFGKLVLSPFFSLGRNLYPLYELLGKYHPDFSSSRAKENLTKEKIYGVLNPGKKYDEKKADVILRRLFSDLNKLAEQYLLLLSLKKNTIEGEFILIPELIRRNLDASYYKHIKKVEDHLRTRKIDEFYFRQMADAENLKYFYNLSRIDHQESVIDNVIRKGEYNIIYTLQMLGEAMQNAGANHRVFNAPYEDTIIYRFAEKIDYAGFLDSVLKNPGDLKDNLKLNCFRLMNILNPGNIELVIKFRDMIIADLDKYSAEEQNILLIGALNLMRKAGLGKECFELNRFILEKGLYHLDKTKPFPLIIYRDLFRGALFYNELGWAESFIETYHKKLSTEYRKDMLHYSNAYLEWSRGNYENVLLHCSKLKSKDARVVTDLKLLTLRAYYELEAFEPALSLIDSLILYLKQNKKISREIGIFYSDFAKIIKTLLMYRLGERKVTLDKIKTKIEGSKNIYAIDWLRKKTAELD
ncbi:MAG: hypothetical protein J0M37_06140 [Ignavibacteria bacterium]|nr:hypothetical protein [Ignavibacteria bacterium]